MTHTISAAKHSKGPAFHFTIDDDVIIDIVKLKKGATLELRLSDGVAFEQVARLEGWSPRKVFDSLMVLVEDKVVKPELTYEWCTEDLLERLCECEHAFTQALPKG